MGTHQQGPDARPPEQAEHGYRNEVSWDEGRGRQPYENRPEDSGQNAEPSHEHAEGDRGSQSGTNLDQLEQVKRKP